MQDLRLKQIALSVALLLSGPLHAADPATIDWNSVPVKTIPLFYPAQSTYQWLRSSEHPGASLVNTGAACITCHKDREGKLGEKLVKPNKLEPTPIEGKNGVVNLNVQVAYDKENVYFRFQWRTNGKAAGDAYPTYRFDGKEWRPYGGPRLAGVVRKKEQPAVYEDRLSMMIDDGGVPNFAAQGCWLTCHDGERDSRKQPTAGEVAATPFFQQIKRADVRKYLPSSRTDPDAPWQNGKSLEEINSIKAAGGFLDLIQWRAHRSNTVGMADDGYVLEWRNFDAGANPFASNMDGKTKQPRYMYDEKKFGQKALTEADINKNGTALLRDENAVAFDSNAGWKAGDILPQYYMSRSLATGSAADNKQAKGAWASGTWTVVWARPLNLSNPDDKALREGKTYNIGFAVHDDNVTSRAHHISFPVTVGLGTKAQISATRLK